jgi:hypothetical protein
VRWLHRLTAALRGAENQRLREQSQQRLDLAERLGRQLRAQRAATDTQAALTSRWRSIAHQRAQDNEALRAAQQKEQTK